MEKLEEDKKKMVVNCVFHDYEELDACFETKFEQYEGSYPIAYRAQYESLLMGNRFG